MGHWPEPWPIHFLSVWRFQSVTRFSDSGVTPLTDKQTEARHAMLDTYDTLKKEESDAAATLHAAAAKVRGNLQIG